MREGEYQYSMREPQDVDDPELWKAMFRHAKRINQREDQLVLLQSAVGHQEMWDALLRHALRSHKMEDALQLAKARALSESLTRVGFHAATIMDNPQQSIYGVPLCWDEHIRALWLHDVLERLLAFTPPAILPSARGLLKTIKAYGEGTGPRDANMEFSDTFNFSSYRRFYEGQDDPTHDGIVGRLHYGEKRVVYQVFDGLREATKRLDLTDTWPYRRSVFIAAGKNAAAMSLRSSIEEHGEYIINQAYDELQDALDADPDLLPEPELLVRIEYTEALASRTALDKERDWQLHRFHQYLFGEIVPCWSES